MIAEKGNHQKSSIIVIVDDDEDLLNVLIFALESEGFKVKALKNGKEGLDYLMDEKNLKMISLLILDRLLPDMEGLQILKQIAAKFKDYPPVLILSGLSADRDILFGLKEGAIDYITKPFNLSILLEKAFRLIERQPNRK